MNKNILYKLAALSGTLDKKGCHDEANEIDVVLKALANEPFGPEWEAARKDEEEQMNDPDELRREIGALNIQIEERRKEFSDLREYAADIEKQLRDRGDREIITLLDRIFEKHYL